MLIKTIKYYSYLGKTFPVHFRHPSEHWLVFFSAFTFITVFILWKFKIFLWIDCFYLLVKMFPNFGIFSQKQLDHHHLLRRQPSLVVCFSLTLHTHPSMAKIVDIGLHKSSMEKYLIACFYECWWGFLIKQPSSFQISLAITMIVNVLGICLCCFIYF